MQVHVSPTCRRRAVKVGERFQTFQGSERKETRNDYWSPCLFFRTEVLARCSDRMVLSVPDTVPSIDGGKSSNGHRESGFRRRVFQEGRGRRKRRRRLGPFGGSTGESVERGFVRRKKCDRHEYPRFHELLVSPLRKRVHETALVEQAHPVRVRRRTAIRVPGVPQEIETQAQLGVAHENAPETLITNCPPLNLINSTRLPFYHYAQTDLLPLLIFFIINRDYAIRVTWIYDVRLSCNNRGFYNDVKV